MFVAATVLIRMFYIQSYLNASSRKEDNAFVRDIKAAPSPQSFSLIGSFEIWNAFSLITANLDF